MMKHKLATASTLGTVALGLLAASMSVGCAGASPGGSASAKAEKTAITQSKMSVNGCTVTGVFDITSSDQAIQFVALDKSDLQSAQMQLYTVDDQGRQTQVQQSAQQADSMTQALLDQATSNVNAAETAMQQASQHSAQSNSSTSTTSHESDQTTTDNSSSAANTGDTSSTHSASQDNSQSVNGSQSSESSSASGSQASASNAAQNASESAIEQVLGQLDPSLSINLQHSASSNSSSAANQSGSFQFAQESTNQANASNTANHSDNQSADTSHTATTQQQQSMQMIAHQMDSANSTVSQNGSSDSASSSAGSSSRNEQNATNHSAQSNSMSASSTALVYSDLQTLNSHHLQLVINMTTDQAQSLIRLFEGSSEMVTASQDFPVISVDCGGLQPGQGSGSQPVVQPVASDPSSSSAGALVAKPEH